MTLESTIVRNILGYLNGLPGCKAIKTHGSAYQEAGTPDIIGCLGGRMLALEAKQPGKQPTKLQVRRLEEWRAAGAIAGVVTSVEEARNLLTAFSIGDNISSRVRDS